ncbi:hypothetical protein B0H13DRAFT_2676995 [Mycena leptocephala]|nr:hypothetical protein B0H13DRAFT_2676995 [Mycena leptocephala]
MLRNATLHKRRSRASDPNRRAPAYTDERPAHIECLAYAPPRFKDPPACPATVPAAITRLGPRLVGSGSENPFEAGRRADAARTARCRVWVEQAARKIDHVVWTDEGPQNFLIKMRLGPRVFVYDFMKRAGGRVPDNLDGKAPKMSSELRLTTGMKDNKERQARCGCFPPRWHPNSRSPDPLIVRLLTRARGRAGITLAVLRTSPSASVCLCLRNSAPSDPVRIPLRPPSRLSQRRGIAPARLAAPAFAHPLLSRFASPLQLPPHRYPALALSLTPTPRGTRLWRSHRSCSPRDPSVALHVVRVGGEKAAGEVGQVGTLGGGGVSGDPEAETKYKACVNAQNLWGRRSWGFPVLLGFLPRTTRPPHHKYKLPNSPLFVHLVHRDAEWYAPGGVVVSAPRSEDGGGGGSEGGGWARAHGGGRGCHAFLRTWMLALGAPVKAAPDEEHLPGQLRVSSLLESAPSDITLAVSAGEAVTSSYLEQCTVQRWLSVVVGECFKASTTKHDNLVTTAKKLGVHVLWIHNTLRAPGLRLQVHDYRSTFRCVSLLEASHTAGAKQHLQVLAVIRSLSNCALYPTLSLVLNGWGPLPHSKFWPGTFSNATINLSASDRVMVRVPPTRLCKGQNRRPLAHDPDVFAFCRNPYRNNLQFDDRIGIFTSESAATTAVPVPGAPAPGAPQDPLGRVMVDREKMLIAIAAKEDEVAQRRLAEVTARWTSSAVDLLLPSPAYPLAVQASILHERACRTFSDYHPLLDVLVGNRVDLPADIPTRVRLHLERCFKHPHEPPLCIVCSPSSVFSTPSSHSPAEQIPLFATAAALHQHQLLLRFPPHPRAIPMKHGRRTYCGWLWHTIPRARTTAMPSEVDKERRRRSGEFGALAGGGDFSGVG